MPALGPTNDFYEDSGDLEESSGSDDFQEIILQQSVTMLAYMDRTGYNSTMTSGLSKPLMLFGFDINDVALIFWAAIGAIALMLVILTGVIIWYCCKLQNRIDKTYCLNNSISDENSLKHGQGNMHQSDSVVFLGLKANQVSTRTLNLKRDFCKSFMTRSQSVPLKEGKEAPKMLVMSRPFSKRRPLSQPIHLPFSPTNHSPKKTTQPYNYHHLPDSDYPPSGLASIPETVLRSSEFVHGTSSHNLYASCNALDGPRTYSSLYSAVNVSSMKTRSLPLWGRSKLRPLSTEDDLSELYAKVNFSKKRKNRMRSDSAAAIAVNKSRTNQSSIQFAHKDTDSLVENEAVVVYDERTAL